jgi:hypothetical protein
MFPPHVLGPKYERRQSPRNSQGFQIGRSRGNLAMTPDVAVVISLNRFWAPVDDTVTAHSKTQVTLKYRVPHGSHPAHNFIIGPAVINTHIIGLHYRGEKGKPGKDVNLQIEK